MLTAAIVAAVMVAIAVVDVLCAAGRIPRNGFAGIRTPALLASDCAWRAGHRAAAPTIALTAGACVLVVLVAAVLAPFRLVAVFVVLVAMVTGVLVGAVVAVRAARRA